MAMPEREVRFQPRHHGAHFHGRLELTALCETPVGRESAEVRRALARFRLDLVEVGLKCHGILP
jgi:hypothetical protein